MDALFEMVDELFEVAVGNVVAAPVGDCIELDAVGELHFVLPVEPATFGFLLGLVSFFAGGATEIVELVGSRPSSTGDRRRVDSRRARGWEGGAIRGGQAWRSGLRRYFDGGWSDASSRKCVV